MIIKQRVAVITGANRGIGFEICRQLAEKDVLTVLTARNEEAGLKAAQKLQKDELPVRFHPLDVDHPASIERLVMFMEKEFGRCDILVNNAGIFLDGRSAGEEHKNSGMVDVKIDTMRRTMTTNVYGPVLTIQALLPLMRKNGYGRIVNISSGLGQLSEMGGGFPAYRMSKTAINVVTCTLAEELAGSGILVNSMCPGWVKTDMGGPSAPRSVEEGADTAVWLATLPDGGPTGKLFHDRKEAPW